MIQAEVIAVVIMLVLAANMAMRHNRVTVADLLSVSLHAVADWAKLRAVRVDRATAAWRATTEIVEERS